MSYRYTNTDKWNDSWFSSLKQIEMLLFVYLCDNCDIAGFIEINFKRWCSDLGSNIDTIKGALEGLGRGLVLSNDGECIFVRNFLRHQKNLPLNENNKAHIGILRRFELYSQRFGIEDIEDFIEGASKGLQSPTGNGIGIDVYSKDVTKERTWRDSYDIYMRQIIYAYNKYTNDKEWMQRQEFLNPNVDVKLSIEKGYSNFWGTKRGWEHKKKSRTANIDWEGTIINSISLNKVYLPRNERVL